MKKSLYLLLFLSAFLVFNLNAQGFEYFISSNGNKLMDGSKEYRFLSFNAPNLNFIEDEMAFTALHPYRLPTEYEIRDVLLTIKQMGGEVVRIYTIPVKRSDEPADVPASVLGPCIFNEDAFKVNDQMLAIANELGIRIIFPFVNNWKWMGGRPQYAEFRGKTQDEFWTDRQLIEDVKKTIEYTINRTNTITGIKYKDDKAILCWETGNELQSPPSWTIEITRYIKELDKNHLVMDGNAHPVNKELLDEPSIDIVNTHHYETDPAMTIDHILKNLALIAGKKPYIIGEFGFQSTSGLSKVMDQIIANHDIAGALIWGLRGHREEGGFYWHSEPFGRGVYKAYHWPGFPSGNLYDEENFMPLMRQKAYEIRGIQTPMIEKPSAPVLLAITNVWDINWKGSVGASFYNIERTENLSGSWQVIAQNITDASVQYFPLFHDRTAIIGKSYYYRVIACNIAGLSDPSNIIGPVKIESQAVIDNMSNNGTIYYSKGINSEYGTDRAFKEDLTRLGGQDSSEIIYYIPGQFISARIYSFEKGEIRSLTFETSPDNKVYAGLTVKSNSFIEGKNDYGYWNPVLYETERIDTSTKYIKISFHAQVQLSRVEIIYR